MTRRLSFLALAVALTAAAIHGQEQPKADAIKPAPSRITAVTVYQNTALVTREVTLPDAAGLSEVIVSPLPPFTMESSLYAEGTDGTRVLSVRFRTRQIAEDTREEVRKLETQLKTLTQKGHAFTADLKAADENLKLLDKMESFSTNLAPTEKNPIDPDKVIALAKFVQDDRVKRTKERLTVEQSMQANQEQIDFTKRLLGNASGGSVRTERDAVIVIDKKAGAATARLNYLVNHASWRPVYKFRAGTKDKDPVTLEYLAAITQSTGEDWTNAAITLSTAQPLLNAAPPDLRVLEVSVGGHGFAANPPAGQPGQPGPNGPPGVGGGGFAMPNPSALAKDLEKQAKAGRAQAADNYNMKNPEIAGKQTNDAAALEQFRDLVLDKEELAKGNEQLDKGFLGDGPSVTFALKGPLTIPSRGEEQVLEVTRFDLAARVYYKAVPVLTPNVYRIADLTNTSEFVLLPGEATMYIGTNFVGQTKIPLVASGKPFTVGFGADPQLQVNRVLLDKTRTTQGGNQVLTFKYRINISSYKKEPVTIQVWDRMPHAEAAMTIAITIVNPKPELSTDPMYVRDEKTKGLLRWDVTVQPNMNGEKAQTIEYEFKMELDKNINIGGFLSK